MVCIWMFRPRAEKDAELGGLAPLSAKPILFYFSSSSSSSSSPKVLYAVSPPRTLSSNKTFSQHPSRARTLLVTDRYVLTFDSRRDAGKGNTPPNSLVVNLTPLSTSTARTSAMSRPLRVAALLYLVGHVFAHEHHMDDIPEGEAVSAEPIVPSPTSRQFRGGLTECHRILYYGSTY